ncbi:MAG: CTP synthase [Lactobacillaceae bacterium]|jgi:CTP synthase|nr:CTP synthase [Lactobacillaceae bacterium]
MAENQTKQTKYIFVTGGVVSSLGKGIVAASLGRLLESHGLKVAAQKFDPYLNYDAGTMSPYEHGETFVTNDGLETDLDMGHYERFMDIETNYYSNVTRGKINYEIYEKERRGDYDGATVQEIPHVTNLIKEKMRRAAETTDADIVITEIGGTVGDIESQDFMKAISQMKDDLGEENVFYIHASLIIQLSAAGEMKTKPTQHSVEEYSRQTLFRPDMLVLRTTKPVSDGMREKLSMFTNVPKNAIIESRDADVLYEVPLNLHNQGMDEIVLEKFGWNDKFPRTDLADWKKMVDKIKSVEKLPPVEIAIVGKYAALPDAYISIDEALRSAGYKNDVNVKINTINSENVNEENVADLLKNASGVLVPGGFGVRGTEGKIEAIKYARENNVPFFGVCLGMQMASVEFARNVLGLKGANSIEMDPETQYPVIALMDSQKNVTNRGGTLRLGAYPAKILPGTHAYEAYEHKTEISERHRHRFEFNIDFKKQFEDAGFVFSGTSPDDKLMEVVEYPKNRFHVAAQYHPEFLSRPNRPEGLYNEFVQFAAGKK